jgi:hypothetical protein
VDLACNWLRGRGKNTEDWKGNIFGKIQSGLLRGYGGTTLEYVYPINVYDNDLFMTQILFSTMSITQSMFKIQNY